MSTWKNWSTALSLPRLVAAWGVVVAIGLAALARHEFTAAPAAHGASTWPSSAQIVADPERPTLLMFVHPNCPCTDASMEEFSQLITRIGDKVSTQVIFYTWDQSPADPRDSGPWKTAARLPGVSLRIDIDGTLARQFGGTTSGQVLLYDHGKLLFSGGITGSRGHAGDNRGVEALIELVEHPQEWRPEISRTEVFGCSIIPEATPKEPR